MNWIDLTEHDQLDQLIKESFDQPALIFKHSTRCAISSMAISRLERAWEEAPLVPYYLDLISYRDISNRIESEFNIMHQSPQALVIAEGRVVYDASHNAIDFGEIITTLSEK